jgi:membrane peptidoglycan carboxypeptidase
VFLTRNKTIARKIEEALLVWLIEEHRLVSKERMLEVYLNIIEWGPGIYGIGQASKFYFNKKPSLLSLEECIFLAMIIPRPKGFAYHFDPEGALKEYTSGYFNLLGGLLIRKGVIDSTQKNPETSKIIINGPAKNYLFKNDSIAPVDSSFIENTSFTEEIP